MSLLGIQITARLCPHSDPIAEAGVNSVGLRALEGPVFNYVTVNFAHVCAFITCILASG